MRCKWVRTFICRLPFAVCRLTSPSSNNFLTFPSDLFSSFNQNNMGSFNLFKRWVVVFNSIYFLLLMHANAQPFDPSYFNSMKWRMIGPHRGGAAAADQQCVAAGGVEGSDRHAGVGRRQPADEDHHGAPVDSAVGRYSTAAPVNSSNSQSTAPPLKRRATWYRRDFAALCFSA